MKVRTGMFQVILGFVSETTIGECAHVTRIDFDGGPVVRYRAVDIALGAENDAAILQGNRIGRIKPYRLAVIRHRAVKCAFATEDVSAPPPPKVEHAPPPKVVRLTPPPPKVVRPAPPPPRVVRPARPPPRPAPPPRAPTCRMVNGKKVCRLAKRTVAECFRAILSNRAYLRKRHPAGSARSARRPPIGAVPSVSTPP